MKRSGEMSIAMSNMCQPSDCRWDTAIRDAEVEIRLLARQMARLKQAVRIFEKNKAEGVQWPSSCADSGVNVQDGVNVQSHRVWHIYHSRSLTHRRILLIHQ